MGVSSTLLKDKMSVMSERQKFYFPFLQASKIKHELLDCNKSIQNACAGHRKVNQSVTDLANCMITMQDYKNASAKCQVKT